MDSLKGSPEKGGMVRKQLLWSREDVRILPGMQTNGAGTVRTGGRDTARLGNGLDLERKVMEGVEVNPGVPSWLRTIIRSKV